MISTWKTGKYQPTGSDNSRIGHGTGCHFTSKGLDSFRFVLAFVLVNAFHLHLHHCIDATPQRNGIRVRHSLSRLLRPLSPSSASLMSYLFLTQSSSTNLTHCSCFYSTSRIPTRCIATLASSFSCLSSTSPVLRWTSSPPTTVQVHMIPRRKYHTMTMSGQNPFLNLFKTF